MNRLDVITNVLLGRLNYHGVLNSMLKRFSEIFDVPATDLDQALSHSFTDPRYADVVLEF